MNHLKQLYKILFLLLLFVGLNGTALASKKDNPKKKLTHTVRKGDNLYDISKHYNCSVEDLRKWNKLTTDKLKIGQKLTVNTVVVKVDIKKEEENNTKSVSTTVTEKETPVTKKYKTVNIASKPKVYSVKKGDCLSIIAEKNNITVSQLKTWNKIRKTNLSIGQKLYVSNPNPPKKILDERNEYADNFNFSALLSDTVKNNPLFVNDTTHNMEMTQDEVVKIDSIINYARTFLGLPYGYRGYGHQFDCSGYTMYVFSKFGIKLPPSAPAQAALGKKIEKSELRKGDLVFFKGRNSRKKRIGHVGMVISVENGVITMIHSASSGIKTEKIDQSAYYANRYVTARRVL